MRIIDADTLKESIQCSGTDEKKMMSTKELYKSLISWIDDRPTIEPERKKGKWNHGLCSVCGYDWGKDAPIANVPPFCPNCGADNRGEEHV